LAFISNQRPGSFGAHHIPKAFKVIEIMGILQARRWQVALPNEFRAFFGLKKYEKMEDINPDPQIADTLRKLYADPSNVELYPGKPNTSMDGCSYF
jgi:linoleate 10R-lipoxygenase